MTNFRSEPFLWIHLSGLAVLPLCLELVWLGLSIGEPFLPFRLELLLIALIGIVPIFLMQWKRPFDIFSLLIIALNPTQLTSEQRQLLSLFKLPRQKIVNAIAPIILLIILWQLYKFAPVATIATANFPQIRILGFLVATFAFLLSNLFLQVPLSVLAVLLTKEEKCQKIEPYAVEKIAQDFTIPGIKINQVPSFLVVD